MRSRLRPAAPGDAPAYARLFGELGLDEPAPSPARFARLAPHMEILELDGAPAGFTIAEREGEVGYLRQIVVDPAARGRGLGRRLCLAAAARLRAAGARTMRLNVKDDNQVALALYRSLGLETDHRSAALWATHATRLALPGEAQPLAIVVPSPAEEVALEARFAISPGQLAHFGARGERVLAVRPSPRGDAIGVMRFSRSLPGAFPFRADGLPAARALLGEIARAVPSVPRVALLVERDDVLAEALLAAGAVLRFRLYAMRGRL